MKIKPNKTFFIIGLSYKKADLDTRSKFSLSKKNQLQLLNEAKTKGINHLMVLSTCNRIEIIGFSEHSYQLISLLCKYSKGTINDFSEVSYVYKRKEAAEHFIKTATGLNSQILGDYEIVGQIKKAFEQSKLYGMINSYMERLYNLALQASKETKNTTSLSTGTTTLSYAAIQYIKENVVDVESKQILIYGLGEIGTNTAKSCVNYIGENTTTVINRTNIRAIELSKHIDVFYQPHSALKEEVSKADIIIVATGAAKPTLKTEHFSNDKKQLIIDLSVPQNVDKKVKLLDFKELVNVDLLANKTIDTLNTRKKQIPLVETIVAQYVQEFLSWLNFRKSTPAIKSFKETLELMQQDVINSFSKKNEDFDIEEANELTSVIINKMVSKYAIHLKENHFQNDVSIQTMNQIFNSELK